MNFNYIFITINQSDLVIRFSDINKTEYSRFIPHDPYFKIKKNKIISFLFKVHKSNRIKKYIQLPFKNIWDKYHNFDAIKNINFNNSNSICIIIQTRYFASLIEHTRNKFLQYLRTEYKNCRIVLYYSDLVSSHSCFNISKYIQQFDAIFTFDKEDALKNDFFYYEEQFFSDFDLNNNLLSPLPKKSDITFIGKAKNRFNEIIKIFELLQKNNIVCDFHIIGAPFFKKKYSKKINYHFKDIPYYRILKHAISSKCVLEILQQGGTSSTARVSEAIYFGKKLLTNCLNLKTKPYYNPEYISVFSDPNDIDINFLKRDTGNIDYNYKHNLSPLNFINFVDTCLSLKINNKPRLERQEMLLS
jgi:hypothetical protein